MVKAGLFDQPQKTKTKSKKMKTINSFTAILCAMTLLGGISVACAAAEADETKTVTGEAKCATCLLKEKGDTHQTAIQVKEGDKTVTYYLVANDVSKKLDKKVCEKPEKVTATGTVKTVDGKLQFTATKIERAT